MVGGWGCKVAYHTWILQNSENIRQTRNNFRSVHWMAFCQVSKSHADWLKQGCKGKWFWWTLKIWHCMIYFRSKRVIQGTYSRFVWIIISSQSIKMMLPPFVLTAETGWHFGITLLLSIHLSAHYGFLNIMQYNFGITTQVFHVDRGLLMDYYSSGWNWIAMVRDIAGLETIRTRYEVPSWGVGLSNSLGILQKWL